MAIYCPYGLYEDFPDEAYFVVNDADDYASHGVFGDPGRKINLKAYESSSHSGSTYTWSSSDTSVATVSANGANCEVTIVGAGECTITCTSSSGQSCTFNAIGLGWVSYGDEYEEEAVVYDSEAQRVAQEAAAVYNIDLKNIAGGQYHELKDYATVSIPDRFIITSSGKQELQ